MFALVIRCDTVGEFLSFCVFVVMIVIVGFVGVFSGTLILPKSARRNGSKHLLLFGLAFSALLLFIFPFVISLVPLALGGFIAVLIFRKLDKENSEAAIERHLVIVLTIAICCVISFVILLTIGGRPTVMTPEKAAQLFDKVGGIDKVQQEAKAFFNQAGTNYYWLHQTDKTKYPALSALGQSISIDGEQKIIVKFGGHFHTKFIYIFQVAMATKNNAEYYTSSCIQVATNIFITK